MWSGPRSGSQPPEGDRGGEAYYRRAQAHRLDLRQSHLGHIRLGTKSLESIQADTQRWFDEVGSWWVPLPSCFTLTGSGPTATTGRTPAGIPIPPEPGFRVFASVGIESFSYIKKDLCAVICDRLHPDGTTLRHSRDRYLQFYDAKDIMDVTVRPQREIDWA